LWARKIKESRFSGFNMLLFTVAMLPAEEKTLSEGVEVAGT
jgi:hypothetical protein